MVVRTAIHSLESCDKFPLLAKLPHSVVNDNSYVQIELSADKKHAIRIVLLFRDWAFTIIFGRSIV